MQFYRDWVPIHVVDSYLFLWLLVTLLILGGLLWMERKQVGRWLEKRAKQTSLPRRRRGKKHR